MGFVPSIKKPSRTQLLSVVISKLLTILVGDFQSLYENCTCSVVEYASEIIHSDLTRACDMFEWAERKATKLSLSLSDTVYPQRLTDLGIHPMETRRITVPYIS